ncbi:Yip1-domain-containing protein [Suhomyces tanzawaensis NRRL Y-17324]|uniref:Protein YIP n=1 Tax=Suhomyces tanzawaensis NRRL Y-17324 TaxID=984487 RepID=A0A1E4SIW7_9ASCO|nr:Yip1-domain-containing protein [Suhomyces tanzawaensis NRRL Y-17324]ODV79387.1 Yip1-domain-containing protein [Suhomyces tanzawaensis NRRL Y-17324]
MSNEWSKPTYLLSDVNDFIIADEDVPPAYGPGNSSANASTSTSNNTNTGFNLFSNFYTPKVDLSSTFAPFTSSNLPGNNTVRERQYTGGDTLDEPVWATLKRDLSQIGRRLAIVIWPMQLSKLAADQQLKLIDFAASSGIRLPQLLVNNRMVLVSEQQDPEQSSGLPQNDLVLEGNLDWDLWGPLIFSLMFSVALGISAKGDQTNLVFSGSFSFIWAFFIVIGLNIQLLGGSISFMSAISAAGYSLFPIVVGELICSLLVKWKLIRLILMAVLNSWSIYSGVLSLQCSGVLPGRVLLAIYPVGLMYTVLSWLVVIT